MTSHNKSALEFLKERICQEPQGKPDTLWKLPFALYRAVADVMEEYAAGKAEGPDCKEETPYETPWYMWAMMIFTFVSFIGFMLWLWLS